MQLHNKQALMDTLFLLSCLAVCGVNLIALLVG